MMECAAASDITLLPETMMCVMFIVHIIGLGASSELWSALISFDSSWTATTLMTKQKTCAGVTHLASLQVRLLPRLFDYHFDGEGSNRKGTICIDPLPVAVSSGRVSLLNFILQ